MKAIAVLSVALLTIIGFDVRTAGSQAACTAPLVACIDACIAKTNKTLNIQDTCIQACQHQNGVCSNKILSGLPQSEWEKELNTVAKSNVSQPAADDEQPKDDAKPAKP